MAKTYTVKAGDTLSQIAKNYGVDMGGITGYKSGDVNKIGVGEVLNINAPDLPPVNNINATDLNAKPLTAPPETPKTGYAGLIESTNAVITDTKTKVDTGETDIKGIYDKLGTKNTDRTNAYTDEGVYDKQKTYNDLTNTMSAKDLAYRRKVEKIRNENPTGQLSEGQRIAIDKEDKAWASEKADLAIAAAFAKDDYTTAKTIVDDRIKAETEDLTTELAGLQFFYSQNYNKLTDAQKTLLMQETQQVQNQLDEKTTLLADVGNIQLEAAKNGAPASVIMAIGKATDTTGAIAAGGQYIGLYDRKAEDRLGGGGGNSGIKFSDSQIQDGAANAGVTLSSFNGFDEDTKNFFVNGDITGSKKSIDDAFIEEGAALADVQASINEMTNLPQKGRDFLLQYAEQSAKENEYTTDKMKSDLVLDLTAQKEEGKNRAGAYDAVKGLWSKDGDGNFIGMTPDEVATLNAAIEDVYGKRTWLSKILPGGN